MNYKATRTPPKFQIRNKGVFIYYVINIGGRGVSQMLMFVDMGGRASPKDLGLFLSRKSNMKYLSF